MIIIYLVNNMQQHQIINALMNLDNLFLQLNQLRFKGRQLIEQLINILYEKDLINQQSRKQTATNRRLVFEPAQRNCLYVIGTQIAKIEAQLIENYITLVTKVALNVDYLKKQAIYCQGNQVLASQTLIVIELISLAIDLGSQYQRQKDVIQSQWKLISGQLCVKAESNQKLRELMLHVGFQSWIQDKNVVCWRQKLVVLSNQRYNPKKE